MVNANSLPVFLGVVQNAVGGGSTDFKPLMKILPNSFCCFRGLVDNGRLIYLQDEYPELKVSAYFEKYFGAFARDLVEAERVDPDMFSGASKYMIESIRKMLRNFYAFFSLREPPLERLRGLA